MVIQERESGRTPSGSMITGYARAARGKSEIESRRQELLALGAHPDHIFVDCGGRRTDDRPGLRAALAGLGTGDMLVVAGLERLARSVLDARNIINELASRGARLNVGGLVHDPTEPVGRVFFDAVTMMAAFELGLLNARTKEGMQIAKINGRRRGRQPKLTAAQAAHLTRLHEAGEHTGSELAELFAVSRTTVYRVVGRNRQASEVDSSRTA